MSSSVSPLPAGSVVALAGRRPDAPDAPEPRFPLANVPRVREELRALLHPGVHALVCSAACGADLLALQAAGEAGIDRHVVLPFDAATFRATSVADRPGDWGPLYDAVIADVGRRGRLECGAGDPDDPGVYLQANGRIVGLAAGLAAGSGAPRPRVAVVAWEGAPRGSDDATGDFRRRAEEQGFIVRSIRTV